MSVAMGPGCHVVHGDAARARDREPSRACRRATRALGALNSRRSRANGELSPATEPIEMMRPPSCISGAAARTAAATPPTLTANRCSISARLLARSLTELLANTPALLTRMSRRPKRSITDLNELADVVLLALVGLEGVGADALGQKVVDDILGLVLRGGIADGDVRTVLGEGTCDGCADAARAAGDQGHLSVEFVRHGSILPFKSYLVIATYVAGP